MLVMDDDITTLPECKPAAALWSQWSQNRSAESRNALFLHYSNWLRGIASGLMVRYRYPLAEWADYVHCASIGLLQAIDQFDPSLQVPFEAYAYQRVKGATLNGLADFLSEARKNTDLEEAAEYSFRLDDHYNADDEPLHNVVDAVVGLALGRFLELGVAVYEEPDNCPQRLYESASHFRVLHELLDELPERERFVLTGHYLHQMEFKQLAELMQISAPRVTQLHHQALRRLRKLYEAAN